MPVETPAQKPALVVTGADGLIGSHLCDAFAAAGWEVRALARPGVSCSRAKAAGAALHFGELDRPEGALLASQLAQGTSLFAHASFPGGGQADRHAALAMVRAACAAALSAGAPLLLLSSCTVYGRPRNLPCDEGELKAPVDEVGEARWAVEQEAFLFRRRHGLKLVVLRPALTYGSGQRRGLAVALVLAALASRLGRALFVPHRGPVVHTVHAEDVAQAALKVAEAGPASPALEGRALNVADDVPLPLEELSQAIAAATGARAVRLPYSSLQARWLLWVLRRLPNWIFWRPLNARIARGWLRAFDGKPQAPPPVLGPDLLEQFSADRYFDTGRLRALGFVPRHPSAVEGIRALVWEQREVGLLPQAGAPEP
jgi:nucleoside-diphosphate-sugar epimerase